MTMMPSNVFYDIIKDEDANEKKQPDNDRKDNCDDNDTNDNHDDNDRNDIKNGDDNETNRSTAGSPADDANQRVSPIFQVGQWTSAVALVEAHVADDTDYNDNVNRHR